MTPRQIRRWSISCPVIEFDAHPAIPFEQQARESYAEGLREIARRVLDKNAEGAYIYIPPGEITARVESLDFWHKIIFDCVFDGVNR